ncbi:hypothetical protein BC940DRAFT_296985 [Gongronella butleri]|nr:hypothetical protein BC940DRAFT_296985 [Gongronella butleri]
MYFLAKKFSKDKKPKPGVSYEGLEGQEDNLMASEPEKHIMTPEEKALRRKIIIKQILLFASMLIVDVGLPFLLFWILAQHTTQLIALIVSGIPPALWVIVKFIWKRKVDALGCLFVFCYILSAILSIVSGDARLALLRDSTVTAVVSAMFLLSLIPIRTRWFSLYPLTFLFAQSMMGDAMPTTKWTDEHGNKHEQEGMLFLWENISTFRKNNYFMTMLWGFVLLGEFIAKVIMIQSSLTIAQIVVIGNIILAVVMVSMTVISLISTMITRRRTARRVREWHKQNDFTQRFKDAELAAAAADRDATQSPFRDPQQSPFEDMNAVRPPFENIDKDAKPNTPPHADPSNPYAY